MGGGWEMDCGGVCGKRRCRMDAATRTAERRVTLGEHDGVYLGLVRLQLELSGEEGARLVHPSQIPVHTHGHAMLILGG